jgi:hypothetical protein
LKTMPEVDSHFVKQGLWTNLDQGEIMGKTITTETRTGIIIIAILAVISTVGKDETAVQSTLSHSDTDFLSGTSHLWNMMVFLHYQIRATGCLADGLFHQQQAILRTLPPPSALMADSVKLWWVWRKRNKRAMVRSLFQFSLAFLCSIGILAVSIFSSYVVTTTDLEVLVNSPSCGFVNDTLSTDAERSWVSAITSNSAPYAKECYQNRTVNSAVCKEYVRPSIPFETQHAACPFSTEFCQTVNGNASEAVAFDSGVINLNHGFGLNLAKHDEVGYRRRTTCAVLPLAGHATHTNASDIPDAIWGRKTYPGEEAFQVHYGDRPALGESKNATFFTSLLGANMSAGFFLGYTYLAPDLRKY